MGQNQLVNRVVEVEYKQEQQKDHWPALYVNYLASPLPHQNDRKPLLDRIFPKHNKSRETFDLVKALMHASNRSVDGENPNIELPSRAERN